MTKRLSRRTLLRGGSVAIGLPFLEAMAGPRRAQAQGLDPRHAIGAWPKRFLVIFSANGTIAEHWMPQGTETVFTLPRILAPFEPWQKQMIVLSGIEAVNAKGAATHDKDMASMLTCMPPVGVNGRLIGTAGGPSVDQAIAAQIGGSTRFPSLEIGVQATQHQYSILINRMCYRAPFQSLPPENDPDQLFTRIFGSPTAGPVDLARLRAQQKSVLDLVLGEYTAVAKKVAADDRQKLDAHLTSLREVEQRMAKIAQTSTTGGACGPMKPMSVPGFAMNDNYPMVARAQIDLLVHALACDVTRVASLQFSTAESGTRFRWMGITDGYHDISHRRDPKSREDLTRIKVWHAEQIAYLLGRMAQVREGSGTLLDHTLILWTNEMGAGDTHSNRDVPNVIFGSAGGYFRTGRWVAATPRTPHNNLMISLMNAMGIPATTFGNPMTATGPIAALR